MSIFGDLAAAFSTHLGCTFEEAKGHIKYLLDHSDDPNMAYKFGDLYGEDFTSENEAMRAYWAVIKFLKDTQC